MRSGTTSIAPAVFLFLFGWLALTAAAQAQYPSRMVRAIVPYTPGSSADLIARNLGPRLSEGWKVPFLVDNRAGASRSEEHTSELQSRSDLVCRLLLEKK